MIKQIYIFLISISPYISDQIFHKIIFCDFFSILKSLFRIVLLRDEGICWRAEIYIMKNTMVLGTGKNTIYEKKHDKGKLHLFYLNIFALLAASLYVGE